MILIHITVRVAYGVGAVLDYVQGITQSVPYISAFVCLVSVSLRSANIPQRALPNASRI
jgi:hypothetical protein